MLDELHHECGIGALYWLAKPVGPEGEASRLVRNGDVAALMPHLLQDLQHRGQLSAGMSSYHPDRVQLLDTYKELGSVAEAFHLSSPEQHRRLMAEYGGAAVIGHTRYATCGGDDRRYAQPFERHHARPWKWYAFCFNGNIANFTDLRDSLAKERGYHFSLNNDTEIILHRLSFALRGDRIPSLPRVLATSTRHFDGAYNLLFLDALGRMLISRDSLGLRPMCWAAQGRLFAAASESVALSNLGFEEIHTLEPGQAAYLENGEVRFEHTSKRQKRAHCFFEWVYFAHAASIIDGSSVYLSRARLGEALAAEEKLTLDSNFIVVPVPYTANAAAQAYAHRLGAPYMEGIALSRAIGRTFIQSDATRAASAGRKYTPLPQVLTGHKVLLIEDSIVRSTTLKTLAMRLRRAGATEVHVRVACPPIVAPCFYGIDMSTLSELFAPRFLSSPRNGAVPTHTLMQMARALGVNSLRYLKIEDLARCIQLPVTSLCRGCVTGKYPTPWGQRLLAQAAEPCEGQPRGRTYE